VWLQSPWSAGFFERSIKKPVDDLLKRLHNLISLLLTQQRKTGGAEGWCRRAERSDL
jgi:hypothetical protein